MRVVITAFLHRKGFQFRRVDMLMEFDFIAFEYCRGLWQCQLCWLKGQIHVLHIERIFVGIADLHVEVLANGRADALFLSTMRSISGTYS